MTLASEIVDRLPAGARVAVCGPPLAAELEGAGLDPSLVPPEELLAGGGQAPSLELAREQGCRLLALAQDHLTLLRRHPILRARLGIRFPPVILDVTGWAFDLSEAISPPQGRPRIFGIGLNKTATTSLHQSLALLGLRSLHWGGPEAHRAIRQAMSDDLPMVCYLGNHWDAFSDIRAVSDHFDVADRQYPGSKFILTVREESTWLASRRRHVERNRRERAAGRYQGNFLGVDEAAWRAERRSHHQRVRKYFRNRPDDLLVMDICGGDGFEVLAEFLGVAAPDARVPWANADSSLRQPEGAAPARARARTSSS